MARLFISVERLEAWTAEGRAAIVGDHMTLTELARSFLMKPAVHFVKVTGRDHDASQLIGLVKSKVELEAMGADSMASSVIYADVAYEVIDGFLGEPLPA